MPGTTPDERFPDTDALSQARRDIESLRSALDSRTVLSQAVGLIMATERLTPEAAFARIATRSQAENVKARVIAERMVREFVESLEQSPHDQA